MSFIHGWTKKLVCLRLPNGWRISCFQFFLSTHFGLPPTILNPLSAQCLKITEKVSLHLEWTKIENSSRTFWLMYSGWKLQNQAPNKCSHSRILSTVKKNLEFIEAKDDIIGLTSSSLSSDGIFSWFGEWTNNSLACDWIQTIIMTAIRVNRHLDATVSLYSLAIRLCDVHNKVDRKRRSSKLWNRRANNKKDPWYAFATNESKGCPVIWNFLSTFYEVFDCRKLTHKTLWLKITIKLYERSEPWIHIFFRRENCYFWSFNHQNWRRHHKRLTQHSSTLRDF